LQLPITSEALQLRPLLQWYLPPVDHQYLGLLPHWESHHTQLKDQQPQVTPRSVYDDHRDLRHKLSATSRQWFTNEIIWAALGLRPLLFHNATAALSSLGESTTSRPRATMLSARACEIVQRAAHSCTDELVQTQLLQSRQADSSRAPRALTKARDARDWAAQSAARHGR
jgi:hypothetical protein